MKKNIAIYVVLFLAFGSTSYGQQPITKMQSLYIYNFIKNIKWQNVEAAYVVGVFGSDEVITEIQNTIGVRSFNSKSIDVKKITTAAEASEC